MATRETLQSKAAKMTAELRDTGRVVLRAPALVRAAECAIRLMLGAILAGAEVLGGAAPFGLALVAASGSGTGGFSALLGACFGYLSIHGLTEGLRYVAAAILIFSVSFAFYDLKVYRRTWFMPVVSAFLAGSTGFVYLSAGGWADAVAVRFVGELALTAAAAYFYRAAFAPWNTKGDADDATLRQFISALILGATVLIALSKLDVWGGISVGRLAACLAVMLGAWKGGPGMGAAVGLSAGLSMDLAAGGVPYYSMAYGFAGLMTGVFWKQGRLFAALAYILANAVAVLWSWDSGVQTTIFYEVFIASVCFMLLPDRLTRRLGAAFAGPGTDDAAARAAAYVRGRLAHTAGAFRDLCASLTASLGDKRPNDADTSAVFDRAAARVCRTCALRDSCWQREYTATFNALNDALPAMLDRGRGVATDFPDHFRMRCAKFASFLSCANEELSALLSRRQYQHRLRESRRAVCRQYGELADVLDTAAAELSAELTPDLARTSRVRQYLAGLGLDGDVSVFYDHGGHLRAELTGRGFETLGDPEAQGKLASLLGVPLREAQVERVGRGSRVVYCQAEPLMAVAGVSAKKRDGETVSGDAGTWFKHDDGTLYVLLCDGMGSGEGARRESTLAVRLLEKFLRAGVAPEAALKTLNSALALRGDETGGFTTVDLLGVDLFTGEAAIYKYGAAPTYLKKGDTVTRVAGVSLPAGLITGEGAAPDIARFRLSPGNCVVLVSDGVVSGEEDGWLREALRRFDGASPKSLAMKLVDDCGGEDATDDKTALVLRIGTRN